MSRIVKPDHVDWNWRTTDDGVPDAIVSKGGQSITPLATYATDASGNATGLAGLSMRPRARPNNIMARWFYARPSVASPSASNFTYHETFTVEYAATRFRIALLNFHTATVDVGVNAGVKGGIISVSNGIGSDVTFGSGTGADRYTPSTGSWTNITWSGNTYVTLAARVSASEPSVTWSDWIDISTIPRTDDGTLPVVMVRLYVPSSGSANYYNISPAQSRGQAIANSANTGASATTWTNGRFHQSIRYTGDGITTPANFQPTTDLGYNMFAGIEYNSKRPGFTLLANGDSTCAGSVNGILGNYGNGHLWQALDLVREQFPELPIDLANIGLSSSATDTFLARLSWYINTVAGSFNLAYYQPHSQNDGTPTQAVIDTAFNRWGQASALLNAAGKPFFVSTPMPNTSLGWNAAADAFRLQARTELLAAPYGGVDVADFESVSDGATPARYATAYTTDNAHPNDAGYAVLAPDVAKCIARLVS